MIRALCGSVCGQLHEGIASTVIVGDTVARFKTDYIDSVRVNTIPELIPAKLSFVLQAFQSTTSSQLGEFGETYERFRSATAACCLLLRT